MKLSKIVAALCVGVSLVAGTVQARELKAAVGVPPASAPYFGMDAFIKTLKERTGGELTVRVFPPSLLSLSQTFAGVRDGVVDTGYLPTQMFAANLPDTQLPVELAMLGTNAFAMAGAMSEYMFSCSECMAERVKSNQVYLGSASTGPYWILATKKMSTMDELKGKKLRSAAGPWSRWAQHFGIVAVSISGNEIFEGMSQGTIDGTMNAASELSGLRLIDLAKHITVGLPGGTVHGLDVHSMNRNTWRSLTEAQRKAVLEAAAMGNAGTTWKFNNDVDKNMELARQKGIQIHQPAPDVVARSKAFLDADLAGVAQTTEKTHGIQNATQKIARFRALVDKWEKLLPATTNWDHEAVGRIYYREIYSKIDPKTFGM